MIVSVFTSSTNPFVNIKVRYYINCLKYKGKTNRNYLYYFKKFLNNINKQIKIKIIIKHNIWYLKLLQTFIKTKLKNKLYIFKYLNRFSLYYKRYFKIILSKLGVLSSLSNSDILYWGYEREKGGDIKINYCINSKQLLYYQTYYYNFINNFISSINSTNVKEIFFTNKYFYSHYSIILIYSIYREIFKKTYLIYRINKNLKINNDYRYI
ncbi:hypothetical protein M951_chr1117 (nucleomorph) [Lotharella oceanica]|uniref:Uncharacterized protein n=1 Tax=Lotharella oceanica TaxID=641309 RepID=A0A060DFH4_9EUKA|nr:hypothetical protein M951_chr1117 [Lotharella oceanica]|mmetsp:Transcript_34628/g.64136  ORF Transcript_34628/g.64136 Transcript_34628/m.64136 type:complete len:210 (+) Transcript_34628:2591-3220(+)